MFTDFDQKYKLASEPPADLLNEQQVHWGKTLVSCT